ncbi:unnamed protein product [marine sediment metagenome]|uniref:Uncharacterized protein n=1 Tax=marine sediment metagenome TaxID=412755 RepID=X1QQQ4_9ZZZZ
MIKELNVSLGNISPATLDPPQVGVPVVAPGQVLATGYYTEQTSGQLYYYDATVDQWYYYAAGYLYPLAIPWEASPSDMVDLVAGDTLRLNVTFKYIGPAVTRTFHAAIGTNSKSGSFDEWGGDWNPEVEIDIPECGMLVPISKYIDILIPSGHGGDDGACYCKIMDGFTLTVGENCTPYYYDVCHIIEPEGEFSEFAITKFEKV